MNKKLFCRAVEIAKALKPRMETGKSFHITMAIKKGKIIKMACNNYNKLHNTNKFPKYINFKNLDGNYRASLHSEVNLALRLGEEDWSDYEILNLRIGNLNQPLLACPCLNCMNSVIIPLRPKKLFYSNSHGDFSELTINPS